MSLGNSLKAERERMKLTLRQVEESAAVSNAYLCQLENDKIKKPSADVLYRLSRLYCVPIEKFLVDAGIMQEQDGLLKLTGYDLTTDEEKELIRYLEFLRSKR